MSTSYISSSSHRYIFFFSISQTTHFFWHSIGWSETPLLSCWFSRAQECPPCSGHACLLHQEPPQILLSWLLICAAPVNFSKLYSGYHVDVEVRTNGTLYIFAFFLLFYMVLTLFKLSAFLNCCSRNLLLQPRLHKFWISCRRCFHQSFSFKQILFKRIPRPYGIVFLTLFG